MSEYQPKNKTEHESIRLDNAEGEKRLREQLEKAAERSQENRTETAEAARHEIENATAEKRETSKQEKIAERAPERHRTVRSKASQKAAYNKILKHTQSELPRSSRAFSKVIHNPVVEKVSEFAGSSIARPNAILSGAVFAFILTLAIYLVARLNGYPLSGTETIAAFILGWILGNLYDFFKIMITGKK